MVLHPWPSTPGPAELLLCSPSLPRCDAALLAAVEDLVRQAVRCVSVPIPGGDPSASNGVMVDHEELLRRNTQNLMSAVSSLPELQVRQPITDGWRHQASNPGSCCVPCCVQHVRALSHLPVAMLLC